jgi:hypothetical protein
LTNGLGQTSPQSARHVKKKRSYRMRVCLVHVAVRDRSMHVRIWRCGLAAHARPNRAWPLPASALGEPHEALVLCSIGERARAGRCAAFLLFFFFFLYLFLLNKYQLIFINSCN